jgi:protoporphyrinogen oxidase
MTSSASAQMPSDATAPSLPRVVVLGGGPAGLAAAYRLSHERKAQALLIEQRGAVGGNAGSFELDGVHCDHGSHRLHAVVEPRVMNDIQRLLGDDLLWRPRHGRILLQGRWIHFPLKPVDLLAHLPKAFTARLMFDTVRKVLPRPAATEENFATVVERGLGPTMSKAFYFPYVRKLWGLSPDELAVTLARRRVSGSSVVKIVSKMLRQLGGTSRGKGPGFYYPRRGFGAISERFGEAALRAGAAIETGASVVGIDRDGMRVTGVRYQKDGREVAVNADAVWSTLPITALVRMLRPAPPEAVLEAAKGIRFRGMILIYMVLETPQFTEYDAHYFPELSIPISRMSEPKNYSASLEPRDCTVLCAELPSDPSEPEWALTDDALGARYCEWLAQVGLPVKVPVRKTICRRLKFAYPVYDRDYEARFRTVDAWLSGMSNLLSFGRQGLFAHDNTHHAMAMAYAASDCMDQRGHFDWSEWAKHRKEFESHVVED